MSCFISLPTNCSIVHFYVLLKEEYIYSISCYSHWSFLLLVAFLLELDFWPAPALALAQGLTLWRQSKTGHLQNTKILKRWWKTAASPTFSGQCRHTVRPATLVALQPSKGIIRNLHFLTPSQTGSLSTTLSMKMPIGSQMKGTALLCEVAFLGGLFV